MEELLWTLARGAGMCARPPGECEQAPACRGVCRADCSSVIISGSRWTRQGLMLRYLNDHSRQIDPAGSEDGPDQQHRLSPNGGILTGKEGRGQRTNF